jgi:hypothetical protein
VILKFLNINWGVVQLPFRIFLPVEVLYGWGIPLAAVDRRLITEHFH